MRKAFTFLLAFLLVFNIGFIFYHSLQNAEASSSTSEGISDAVADVIVPDLPNRPETEQKNIMDKIHEWVRTAAHAIEFAGLGLFFMAFVFMLALAEQIKLPYKLLSGLLFSVFIALVDECIQIFVEGRSFELKDIGIDTLGATCGIAFAAFVFLLWQRRKKKQEKAM